MWSLRKRTGPRHFKMITYSEAEIDSLLRRFESRKLPRTEWTHEAHLVVAICYCVKYPFQKALELARQNITAHNESVGTPNTDTEGYHETITRLWLVLALSFIKQSATPSVTEICNNFIKSGMGKSSYPLIFYTKERLFSVEARHNWVEPDLVELDMIFET